MNNRPPTLPYRSPNTPIGHSRLKRVGSLLLVALIIGTAALRIYIRADDRRKHEAFEASKKVALDNGIRDFTKDYFEKQRRDNEAAVERMLADSRARMAAAAATRPTTNRTTVATPVTQPAANPTRSATAATLP